MCELKYTHISSYRIYHHTVLVNMQDLEMNLELIRQSKRRSIKEETSSVPVLATTK
jgi:hypothetical protein